MDFVLAFFAIAFMSALAMPFLVLLGAPWVLVAALVWKLTGSRVPDIWRIVLAASILAPGLAPYLYGHGAINLYIVVLGGTVPDDYPWQLALLGTWVALIAVGLLWLFERPKITRKGHAI